MKKNFNNVLLSAFTIMLLLSLIGSVSVTAVETPDQIIDIEGDAIQTQLQSNVRTMFRFHERTRLTICANIALELDINCEALKIGDKDVIIDIEGDGDLRMAMICTKEEVQLGLMNGSLHRTRNRNTYRYLEGVCIAMKSTANCSCKCDCQCECNPECNCDSECPYNGTFLKARLRVRETNQNRLAQWAYYDIENEEWVTVPTINHDGYLTAETDFLATWTLLVPEETTSAIAVTVTIASVGAIGTLAISVFYLKKRH